MLEHSELTLFLKDLFKRYQNHHDGEVASYIPELARVPADQFAISMTLANGETISVGDDNALFTIQSVSKPFTYAWALELFGESEVLKYVGVEPTGEEFNSITKLEKSAKPLNAMVNAGSISIAGLISSRFGKKSSDELCSFMSRYAARELKVDYKTFKSELDTGDRNRALGYILKYKGYLSGDVDDILELYFTQCSLALSVRDLSLMGSAFAFGGVQQKSKEKLLGPGTLRSTLSVMLSCGMYNYSGHWLYDIGLPAKSGVSGAILMVVPNVMSVAVYSPRVDELGSSVRGIKVCQEISNKLGLHPFMKEATSLATI